MMAADTVHNFLFPHDVDDDGSVTPLDALVVINHLNRGQDDLPSTQHHFHDVDDDSRSTPLDALIIINKLNSTVPTSNLGASAISQSSVLKNQTGSRVRVELESEGSQTELSIRIDNAPISSSFSVSLNDIALGQIATDSRGRGKMVLSQGDDNREHLPLPDGLVALSPEMELVIGDIVKGKLNQVARVESQGSDSNSNSNSGGVARELHLVATFPSAQGIRRGAEFEQEMEDGNSKRKFKAEIENAATNANFEVSVGGVVVGTITTDSKGKGKIRLSSFPKDASEQPLPVDFPAVSPGTIVRIGQIESPLQRALL